MYFRVKILLLALLCTFFLVSPLVSRAVETQRNITPQQWKQLTDDKAFGYKNSVEKLEIPDKPNKFLEWLIEFFNCLVREHLKQYYLSVLGL